MDLFDSLGLAAIVAALGLVILVGTCAPETFEACQETCGGPERVASVEITGNVATCKCKP